MIKVSVIVPAYNVENYIEKTLTSLVNQTLQEIEIIVVNDGSTDSTLDIINNLQQRYKNKIRVISKKNQGVNYARRTGLNNAQGEFILFVDGDDWIKLTALEDLYNIAKKEELDIVDFNYYLVYKDKILENKKKYLEFINQDDMFKNILIGKIKQTLWSKFIRRQYIIENKFVLPVDIRYCEDVAYTIILITKNPRMKVINKYYYYYLQRESGVTKQSNEKLLDVAKAIDFIRSELKSKGLYDKYKEEFNYFVYMHMYYYRIVNCTSINVYQKELYKIYKKMNINLKNNIYHDEKFKSMPKGIIIKEKLFDISYNLGVFYMNFRKIF